MIGSKPINNGEGKREIPERESIPELEWWVQIPQYPLRSKPLNGSDQAGTDIFFQKVQKIEKKKTPWWAKPHWHVLHQQPTHASCEQGFCHG
mmetsp:Transcript_17730/g.22369  ORF Transcript_17730/g.22369 Transcript_17730/m.22369 type:complete len:92 (+) Transcript_17730:452-727(+)